MLKNHLIVIWVIFILISIMPVSQASALTPEELWHKIQQYMGHGHELPACRYIEMLAQHPDSPYYMRAKKVLLHDHGISIENPRGSYTVKQLFRFQNHLLRLQAKGESVNLGKSRQFSDAWGSPLRSEYVSKQEKVGILYRSAGPDKRYMTLDDFIVESPGLIKSRKTRRKLKFSDWSLSKETDTQKSGGEAASKAANPKSPGQANPADKLPLKKKTWKLPHESNPGSRTKSNPEEKAVTLDQLMISK